MFPGKEDQGEKWSFAGGSEQVRGKKKKKRHRDAVLCGVWC